MEVRAAEEPDLDSLARLWWAGWRDAHAAIVPQALVRLRTLETFRDRIGRALPDVRVIGPVGAPLAFHLVRGNELNQFFVAAEARGTGVAAELMADAEATLMSGGVSTAWLACAIGNDRAARFYDKAGWVRTGVADGPAETAEGPFPLQVWRYEKRLPAP